MRNSYFSLLVACPEYDFSSTNTRKLPPPPPTQPEPRGLWLARWFSAVLKLIAGHRVVS